ncbi:MAG TPA: subclass B1 metallo-beta-lactamase [Bacteroidales bacterium]|nr:subclass B1 metallo-beta-lactamase [Bacteroidales bacterium]
MLKMIKKAILIVLVCLIGIFSSKAQTKDVIYIDEDIQLIHLQDSIYVHVSWHSLENYGRISSNGMIIIRNGQALMIDTPMDNDKTERLTNYLKDSLSAKTTILIPGHYHGDCIGGLEYLQSIGVESIANVRTIAKCKELGLPVPSTEFTDSLSFDFNGERIICRFFGAGHSFDNITVWLLDKNILFGGCLIKSIDSKGLGNTSDAVVSEWDITVKKILETYPNVKIVVPGHGDLGGLELLTHTIKLVEEEKGR